MKDTKTFFALFIFITLISLEDARAEQNGNESGQNITRNFFEYNLYDRNFDRLRGRGIYDEEEEAYPDQYRYVEENDARQATGGRR